MCKSDIHSTGFYNLSLKFNFFKIKAVELNLQLMQANYELTITPYQIDKAVIVVEELSFITRLEI